MGSIPKQQDFMILDVELSTARTPAGAAVEREGKKGLTRKASQKEVPEVEVDLFTDFAGVTQLSGIATTVQEKPVVVTVQPGTLSGCTGTTQGSRRRRRAFAFPRLHPTRIFLLFAALSSMGTIILLYFTLSMKKTDASLLDA